MALTNFPQAPTVSSIYSFQNSAPQLSEATANNTRALQNAFSFGTKLIDFLKSQDQANLIKEGAAENADKIAALEASKINSQDPTMVWRWNEARKDAERQAELNRAASKAREEVDNKTAQEKFKNTVDMLVGQRTSTTPAGMEQQLRNLEATIRDGKNIGADVSMLEKRKNEIEDVLYPENVATGEFNASNAPENLKAAVTDFLNQKKGSRDIKKFIDEHPNLDNEDKIKLNTAFRDAERIEKNNAAAAAFNNFIKSRGYDPKTVSAKIKESLKRQWKNSKK